MKNVLAFSVMGLAVAAVADPVVSDVTLTQTGDTVSIGYTLAGEPAIITVDIQTNSATTGWTSIGAQHLTYFAGDVNKRVEAGTHTMTWKPRKAWPGNAVTENTKAVISAWSTSAPPDYLVTSLVVPNTVYYYTDAASIPFGGVTNDLYKTEYLVMRKIPAANVKWRMGQQSNYMPPHLVTLTNDFYIGIYEVTQRQYELIMYNGARRASEVRPSRYNNSLYYAMRPVERVSYDAIRGSVSAGFDWPTTGHDVASTSFLGELRSKTGLGGLDLPKEAQWEFACRAGSGGFRYTYADGSEIDVNDIGRYRFNGGQIVVGVNSDGSPKYDNPGVDCSPENGTAVVGSYVPNVWGIYDMLGNLREWCLDWNRDDVQASDWDPERGPDSGGKRVYRCGAYVHSDYNIRCADRGSLAPTGSDHFIGFRVAMELP